MPRKTGGKGKPGEGRPRRPTKRVKRTTTAFPARERAERYEKLVDVLVERMAKRLAKRRGRTVQEMGREVNIKMARYRRLLLEADQVSLENSAERFKSIGPVRESLVKAFGESEMNEFDATRIAQKLALSLNIVTPERLLLPLKDMKEEEKNFLYHTKQYLLSTFEVIKARSGPSAAFIQKEKLSHMPFFSFSRFSALAHAEVQKIYGKYNIASVHMEDVPELERPVRVFVDETSRKLRRRTVAGWVKGLGMPRGEKRAKVLGIFRDYFNAIHKVYFSKAKAAEAGKEIARLKKIEASLEPAGFTKKRKELFLKRILPGLFAVSMLEKNSGVYLKSGIINKEMALKPQLDKLQKRLLADSAGALLYVLKGERLPFTLGERLKELKVDVSALAKAAKRLKLIKTTEVKEIFPLKPFLEKIYDAQVAAESLRIGEKMSPDDRASLIRRISRFVRTVGKTAGPRTSVEELEKARQRLKDSGLTDKQIDRLARKMLVSVQSALALKENIAFYRHIGSIDLEVGNLEEQFRHLHRRIETVITKYIQEKYPYGALTEETEKEMERLKIDSQKIDAHLAKLGLLKGRGK